MPYPAVEPLWNNLALTRSNIPYTKLPSDRWVRAADSNDLVADRHECGLPRIQHRGAIAPQTALLPGPAMQHPKRPEKAFPHVKQRCHRCHGSGRAKCPICNGTGEVVLGADVNGNAKFGRCSGCFGLKTTRCPTCNGEGFA